MSLPDFPLDLRLFGQSPHNTLESSLGAHRGGPCPWYFLLHRSEALSSLYPLLVVLHSFTEGSKPRILSYFCGDQRFPLRITVPQVSSS